MIRDYNKRRQRYLLFLISVEIFAEIEDDKYKVSEAEHDGKNFIENSGKVCSRRRILFRH